MSTSIQSACASEIALELSRRAALAPAQTKRRYWSRADAFIIAAKVRPRAAVVIFDLDQATHNQPALPVSYRERRGHGGL